MLSGIFQVVARRKCLVASTGENPDPHLRILLKIVPDIMQLKMRRWAERIHTLWTVQRHDGYAALFFIRDKFVGHVSLVPPLVAHDVTCGSVPYAVGRVCRGQGGMASGKEKAHGKDRGAHATIPALTEAS